MIDREINEIGAGREQRHVDQDRPVECFALPDIVFQHFEYVQYLPEEEQAD